MLRRIIAVVFLLVVQACWFCGSAAAQSSGCSKLWQYQFIQGYGWLPRPPSACYGHFATGPWTGACYYHGKVGDCSRDVAKETGCSVCPDSPGTPVASNPISLATGNTYIKHTDVSLPGRGGGITVTRTWNSSPPPSQQGYLIGMFGANWRSTYEEQVFVGTDYYMKYARGDGSFWSLGYADGSTDGLVEKYQVVAPAFMSSSSSGDGGGGAELEHNSTASDSTPWTFTFGDGEKRLFDVTTGYLTTIIDRNSNTTTISRDSIGRITSVNAPGGRVITFSYTDATNPRQATSVDDGCTTCPGGSTIATYQYFQDGSARLQKVTYADGSSENFQYNDPHSNTFISAVVDGAGKVLESHTYDAKGRGTSGSEAQGVNSVTVAYPQ